MQPPSEHLPSPPSGASLPGDFSGPELAASRGFVFEIDAAARRDLSRLLDRIEAGKDESEVGAAVRAALADATATTRRALTSGHGLILVRGLPVVGRSRAAAAELYAMWGRALGDPQPQNLEGDLLTDVRDTGEDPENPDVRLYRTRAEQDFHTDGADVIGLLCLQGSKTGGESRVVSSARVYSVLRERRPDLAPLLFAPWFFQLPGARARGLPEAFPRPIARFDGKKLETFYIGWYIRNAQRCDGVPKLTQAQLELLDLFESIANDPTLYLDMHFRPGDAQWLRNAFVLHKRTAYEDHPEPHRKRHLLRLWLSAAGIDDSTPRFSSAGGSQR
jgi:hypothetical protein